MLINVGEAYIVVNLISGSLMANCQDLQQFYGEGASAGGSMTPQQIHIAPDVDVNSDDPSIKLKLKIFGGPSAGEVYYYKQDLTGKRIIIGRTPDCDIKINDKLLSKCQASVSFVPDTQQWVLVDGFKNKPSTNGTWIYLNENFEMHTGMIFKANQTIFNVELKTARLSAMAQ